MGGSSNSGTGNGGSHSPAPESEALNKLSSLIKSMPSASPSQELDNPFGNSSSNSSPAPPPTQIKPHPQSANHHRKTSSSATASASSLAANSSLNPTASGFQPGALQVIQDTDLESLITPTASNFDLMTGMQRTSGGNVGGFRQQSGFSGGFAPNLMGGFNPIGGGVNELPEEIPGFGGVAGLNARAFSFPNAATIGLGGAGGGGMGGMNQAYLNSLMQNQAMLNALNAGGGGGGGLNSQQLMEAQQSLAGQAMIMAQIQASMNQQQQQQQQQNQLPPRFSQGGMGGVSGGGDGLTPEQISIQQQLEVLQRQQEMLMARLEESNQAQVQAQQVQQQQQQQQAQVQAQQVQNNPMRQASHRRHQSQQVQSPSLMGNFGQQMGSFGLQSFSSGGMGGGLGVNVPKGHGRRHSVNVVNKSTQRDNLRESQGSGVFDEGEEVEFLVGNDGMSGGGAGGGGVGASGGGMGHIGHRRNQSSMSGLAPSFPINSILPSSSISASDLAAAQNQLQQLSQFRASSGHGRVPSFGFANPMNMMSTPGGPGGGVNSPMRKSLFAPYLPQASIPPLLATGKLVIGTLRVNKRNRSDAYVTTDTLDSDIYICGSKDRNRALEGDIVAVELLNVDDVWGTKKEKEEKKRKKEENSFDTRATQDMRKADKRKDDVEVEGQGLILFEDEEVNDEQKPQFAGHIVAVVERMPGQLFSGTLGVLRPSSAATKEKQEAERREREGVDLQNERLVDQKPRIVWFKPTDKRVPLIAIPTEQAPRDFLESPAKYNDQLFVACIKRWPITSLHPFGTLVEQIGTIGDLETETQALLKDCNFSTEDFSENVIKCLPPLPYDIPVREFEVRKDYRSTRIFTIDPSSAKDLDDAIHVSKIENGLYEVGVHIADVSFFVKPNTALDREARKRATTVYLVQKAIPMLPNALSEQLCSLNPGEDKLAFSVVFKMTEDGKVVGTWFGKSVINSCTKLAYSDAQAVIEGQNLSGITIGGDHTATEIAEDIKILHNLAKHLNQKRFDNGALRIDQLKPKFRLSEDGIPEDCTIEERKDANFLIEEFMLLANISVAAKVAASLPEQALLRRHEPPIERRLEGFTKRCNSLGIDMDIRSSQSIMASFNKINDPNTNIVVNLLATKAMLKAKYFCSGVLDIAHYSHYALNIPLYTHFTSPIRRYADVLIHRQLEAVLLGSVDVKFNTDTEAVHKIAQNCNLKRDAAKLAQEQSAHLYLCALVSDLTLRYGPVIRMAIVVGVLDEAFDVIVPEFGVEKRVHVDQIPLENSVYDEYTKQLTLYWKPNVDSLRFSLEASSEAPTLTRNHAKLMDAQSGIAQAESALFDDEDDEDNVIFNAKSRPAPEGSKQYEKSKVGKGKDIRFEGVEKTANGHHTQKIKELIQIPVIIASDMKKSPPIIKILAVNPFCA